MDGSSDGYTWSGDLNETDIRSLYAACHSLRFSGRLQLKDGPTQAEVLFVAGEPIEIDGGDTQRIALWRRGTFHAVQAIPSLTGELTASRTIEGSLTDTKPSALWAWISEYRLTCEIELERPGSKAVVTFANGHAESAMVNGMPELAALARVSSWTDGRFSVRLKPLFAQGVIPVAPPMPEGAPPTDPRQFDVSRSLPLDLKQKAASAGSPPLGELAQHEVRIKPERGERGTMTQPLPPAGSGLGTADMLMRPIKPKGSKAPWIVSLLAIAVAGGLGALYYLHLPPFSPPPKPDEPTAVAPPEPGDTLGSRVEPPEPRPPEPRPPEPKPEAKPEPAEPVEPAVPVEAKPEAEKVPPAEVKKPDERKPDKVDPKTREKADRLVQKGRLYLIENHAHTALGYFKRAEKLLPNDNNIKTYQLQALGKLGRAEIVIEGRGSVVIDGHKFAAPRRLKVPAGPHTIDEAEVILKRGDKKRLRAGKR